MLCVLCTKSILYIIESNETTNIQVRLFGGVPNLMGQVQLGYHGLWGTVCGSNWDIREAQVVCRQLGYDKAVAATYKSAFGKSTGHVWAQSFNCNGEEGTLDECSITAFTISTSCGNHAEDVGVVCGGMHANCKEQLSMFFSQYDYDLNLYIMQCHVNLDHNIHYILHKYICNIHSGRM